MILVLMQMKVISDKRLELSQAIVSLTGSIRKKKGCLSCECCQSLENENELSLIEKWDAMESFNAHRESEHFKVLRGAFSLLEVPCAGMVHTVVQSEEMVALMDGGG